MFKKTTTPKSKRTSIYYARNSHVQRMLAYSRIALCSLIGFGYVFTFALTTPSQTHSATLRWNPSTNRINVYKNHAKIASLLPVGTNSYVDGAVTAGQSDSYFVTAVDLTNLESLPSNMVSVVIPGGTPPPPTCSVLAVGCRIKVTSSANIRQAPTANNVTPPQYGCPSACATEAAGALGTVMSISPFGSTGLGVPNWIQVKFDTCASTIPNCTGYMGSDNMTIVSTTPPPPPPLQDMTTICVFTNSTTWTCTSTLSNIPSGQAIKSVTTTGSLTNTTNGVKP
jgi:hypothetical protein